MSLPRDVYWAKEDKKGVLQVENQGHGFSEGLYSTRREANAWCNVDERPVKVRIVKEENVQKLRGRGRKIIEED